MIIIVMLRCGIWCAQMLAWHIERRRAGDYCGKSMVNTRAADIIPASFGDTEFQKK